MKLSDTGIIERESPEGRRNFVFDGGWGRSYRNVLYLYCEYYDNKWTSECIGVYFNDDMSDELYDAVHECIGERFFSDMNCMESKIYNMGISESHRIRCGKLLDYVVKYTAPDGRCLNAIYKIIYTKIWKD